MPDTKPGVVLDNKGLCNACRSVEKKNQIDQADLSIKTINSWFDAMDCTRDLLSYGIMKDKIR